jgi:hypothetical protein
VRVAHRSIPLIEARLRVRSNAAARGEAEPKRPGRRAVP